MNDRRTGLAFALRLILELLAVGLAFWVALYLRYPELQEENPQYYDYYLQLAIFLHLVWLVLALLSRKFWSNDFKRPSEQIYNISKRWLIHLLLLALFIVSLQGYYFSRLFLIYFYVGMLLSQWLMFAIYLRLLRHQWMPKTKVVLVGNGNRIVQAYQTISKNNSGYDFLGYYSDNANPPIQPNGGLDDLDLAYVDELMLATEDPEEVLRWFEKAEQSTTTFTLLPDVRPHTERELQLRFSNGLLLGRFRKEPLQLWHNRLIKRIFDIVLSTLLLLLTFWWIIPLVWLVNVFSNRGPLFFAQSRPGKGEKPFTIYKFRSMRINEETESKEAVANDERVTAFGRWLRTYHIDEWPQLWNVLRGDMSLVGPRPHLWMQNDKYRDVIKHFMFRQTLRPGITGLAQVSGLHGDVASDETIHDRVRQDIRYVEEWSLALDVSILIRTMFLPRSP